MHYRRLAVNVLALVILTCATSAMAADADELLKTFLGSTDRAALETSLQELAAVTLSDAQVQTLIDAAKDDKSDAHRAYVWRAIMEAQSSTGRKYLAQVLAGDADDGAVMQFLAHVQLLRVGDLPVLTGIYEARKSDLVRGAIVKLAAVSEYDRLSSGRGYPMPRGRSMDASRAMEALRRSNAAETGSARDTLIEWLVKHSDNEDHKLTLIRSAYGRAGVNSFGRVLMRQALSGKSSEEYRAQLWAVRMSRDAREALPELLYSDEPESVKLAGLAAAKGEASRGIMSPDISLARNLVRALKHSSGAAMSEKVKAAAEGILVQYREQAVAEVVSDQNKMLTYLAALSARANEVPAAQRVMFLRQMDALGANAAHQIAGIESDYGALTPEERKRIDDALSRSKAEIAKLRKALGVTGGRAETAAPDHGMVPDGIATGDIVRTVPERLEAAEDGNALVFRLAVIERIKEENAREVKKFLEQKGYEDVRLEERGGGFSVLVGEFEQPTLPEAVGLKRTFQNMSYLGGKAFAGCHYRRMRRNSLPKP